MAKLYVQEVIESNYCKLVFIFSFIISYLLIPHTLTGIFYYLSFVFMIISSLLITCIIRNIKENIASLKTKKGSLISFIITLLGISAFQVCGASFACGASFGLAILAAILPSSYLLLLNEYSFVIIVLAIIVQLISLFYMRCFESKKELVLKKII